MSEKPSLLARLFGGKKTAKQEAPPVREPARAETGFSAADQRRVPLTPEPLESLSRPAPATPRGSAPPEPVELAPVARPPVAAAPAPAPVPAPTPTAAPAAPAPTVAVAVPHAHFVLAMTGAALAEANVPAEMAAEAITSSAGAPAVKLSGGRESVVSGGRIVGAFAVRVSDDVEAKANGKTISVIVTARSAGPDAAPFSVAYSTNGTGNSGWREFTAGPQFAEHAFEYALKESPEPKGNFIGILPKSGTAGVEIAYVGVRIH